MDRGAWWATVHGLAENHTSLDLKELRDHIACQLYFTVKWQPTPVFLPGESHGQRSLVGYSPWGRKELDIIEQLTLSAVNGLPWWLSAKESARNVEDPGSVPGLGKSSGEGNGNPLQYSCLENPMDRGAWWATVHGVAKSQTQLSD